MRDKLILLTSSREVVLYFLKYYLKEDILVIAYGDAAQSIIEDKIDGIHVFNSDKREIISHKLRSRDPASSCIACFSGYIFTEEDIKHFERPIINFHTGKIPENRGRSPLFWDIIEEQLKSYGTLHAISREIDMGRILAEVDVEIQADDSPRTLATKLLQKAFESDIFRIWSNASREKINMILPVKSKGHYKKSFSVANNFISLEHTKKQILLLWRCFQIWNKISINGKYYKQLSPTPICEGNEIECKDNELVYGLELTR